MPRIFNSRVVAALRIDANGVVHEASRGWSEQLQWPATDLVGARLLDAIIPADRPAASVAVQAGASEGYVKFEARFVRPDGNLLRLRCQIEVQEDGQLVLVADDRTLVEETDAKLRSLTDYATDSWFVHDMSGRIVEANKYACEGLGYSRDELLQLHIAEIEQTIQPGSMDGVWKRMEVGVPVTVEGRHRRKDGTEFPVEVRLGLFEAGTGEVLMLALVRDISARKAVEAQMSELNQALERAKDELETQVEDQTGELRGVLSQVRAIVDNMVDGLIAFDRERNVTLANPAFATMVGLKSHRLRGQAAGDLLDETLVELVERALTTEAIATLELPISTGLGLATAAPIHDRLDAGGDLLGEVIGCVIQVRDITLAKEIDRMKTDFIATVSHELRTPLTSVLGFAKITKTKLGAVRDALPDDARKGLRALKQIDGNVDIIVSEGDRLTALINDVLDISKMESGRMEWSIRATDPGRIVQRAVEATSTMFGGPLLCQVDVEAHLPRIAADPDRILQVLINLISNATKFTSDGTVTITARAARSVVEFAVRDTGSGIDPSEHEAVFDRFKQVGDTLTNKPQGTGLGLPICKQIVEHHGGNIWVESALGRGARFAFTVPTTEAAERNSLPPDSLSDISRRVQRSIAAEKSGRDILVVDDDAALRELLRQQLTEHGYNVRLASNGYEAIGQVRRRKPDLIVLDVMMPELSGFDVAAMLKNDPQTEAVPIVILSIIKDKKRGERLGVDKYLIKPAEAEELFAAIEGLLEPQAAGGGE